MVQDEIYTKVMNLLKTYAEHEPNPNNQPINLDYVRDLMIDMMSVDLLVEDKSYHIPAHKSLMNIRRLMWSHWVDFAGESFKQGLSLSQEELDSIQLMHHLWFVKTLG